MNKITEKEIKIIIADDHQLVRRGLRQTIEAEPNFTVVAEASDGQTALGLIAELLPDVAVLDVDMPKMDGLEVARAVAAKNLSVEIVFLTIHSEEALFHHALDLGARLRSQRQRGGRHCERRQSRRLRRLFYKYFDDELSARAAGERQTARKAAPHFN